ncbi:hypothetical protein HMI55_001522 [Coelomomyces lativittatus]|nr:hypothetical protein HMI55_001522 [Coelomomyces lativittatus]
MLKGAIKDPDTVTYANSTSYHSYCFNCAGCKASLADRTYILFKSMHYCDNCYNDLNPEKCAACLEKIQGKMLRFLEKNYHPSCLVCRNCRSGLKEGHGIVSPAGGIYCPKCYEEVHKIFCSACNQQIQVADADSEFYTLNDKRYHVRCFKCSVCSCSLQNSKPFQLNNYQLVCQKDFEKGYKKP